MNIKQMDPHYVEVGNHKFALYPFPAFKAINVAGELTTVLAPILSALAPLVMNNNKDGGNGGLMDIDSGAVGKVFSDCIVDGNKLELLIRKLIIGDHVVVEYENNGEVKPLALNETLINNLFIGEIQNIFVLCFEVIKLNYNGFFQNLNVQSGKVELEKVKRKIL